MYIKKNKDKKGIDIYITFINVPETDIQHNYDTLTNDRGVYRTLITPGSIGVTAPLEQYTVH